MAQYLKINYQRSVVRYMFMNLQAEKILRFEGLINPQKAMYNKNESIFKIQDI